jgi:branched-chain amino acid transport system ATP-binding protein
VKGSALLLVEPYVTRAPEAADYVYLLKRGFGFAGEPSELDAEALAEHCVGK